MTANKLQDPFSTPVTKHLTPVQRAIFNQAVSAYLAERAQESERKAVWHSEGVKLVFAGDESGQLQYFTSKDARIGAEAEVQLALRHVQESSNTEPSVHFIAATLTEAGGQVEATSVEVLDLTEIFGRVLEVDYRYNNTGCRSVCPISGEVFKPYIGEAAFLPGTWTPVFEEILPAAGQVDGDPSRARWTVGEVQASMVAKWRAGAIAREANVPASPAVTRVENVPASPASSLVEDDCPF